MRRHQILFQDHILQQYLPDRPGLNYSLRSRHHNKTLLSKTPELNDIHFVIRNLYKYCYQLSRHMLLFYLSCSAAALISYFCISVYFTIATLVVVAFDNLHSTEMK